MKKLLKKCISYAILIAIVLEVFIRIFHLTKDYPRRFVDNFDVEKWLPNQTGYIVTGPRRQNFSEFKINEFGYNSYRNFSPSKDKIEIALVGDSFIEGFHQDYYNSLGKKIENSLKAVEVYEYGYGGYDLADELHLIYKYKESFKLIDKVIIGLNYHDDLNRGKYDIIRDRMKLETPYYRTLIECKLFVFMQASGVLEPIKNLLVGLYSKRNNIQGNVAKKHKEIQGFNESIKNFESLINNYDFNKDQFAFLLDSTKTPILFLKYLKENNFNYIDYSTALNKSKIPTTLVYDQHWNDYGRILIADIIVEYFKTSRNR